MFVVHNFWLATLFCVITMLGWGSWANTQKLAGKDQWAFPLFYWDYGLGVFLFGILWMVALGSFGSAGMSAGENFRQAAPGPMAHALFSGALFNLSNILLVLAAIVVSAIAHRRLPRGAGRSGTRGVVAAVAAGCLMGFFYPQLAASLSPDFSTAPIVAGFLTPYTALALFGAGLLASNFVWNSIFMRTR